ncbi:MAG: hypothetical protein Q9191_007453 [Dirinaria sp. TL-2023a]
MGDSHALIFRHTAFSSATEAQESGSNVKQFASKCMVEFSTIGAADFTGYREVQASSIYGTLGLINIGTDVFLCVISASTRVATVRPAETVQRILSADFYCLNRNDYDRMLREALNPYASDNAAHASHDYSHGNDAEEMQLAHPCLELQRILSSGTFYYSVDFDLTNRLQDRLSEGSTFEVDNLDQEFLWNSYMIDPLIQFRSRLTSEDKEALDASHILTSAIRGFVKTVTVPAAASPLKTIKTNDPSSLILISRLSCRRAGTRFNSRGIDDDGFVANFVETESVLWHPSGLCFSYAQIRGSVPIFWEQATGLLPGQQKIQITRSPEATQPAFDKHFERLELAYGAVHIINLLNDSKAGEAELTARYRHHVHHSPLSQVVDLGGVSNTQILQASEFDFHAETRGPGGYQAASMIKRLVHDRAENFAYFLCDQVQDPEYSDSKKDHDLHTGPIVILQQEGVFRTNCLDCLDRTNLIQTIINQMAIEAFLAHRNERAPPDFWTRHSDIWADNGDALSKIYAGTGALKSSFTRHGKMSFAGAIADARKSATRMYINNFADKGRQNTIDLLLGRLMDQAPVHLFDPINDYVNSELRRKVEEYTTTEEIQIWVGTFNLNGRGHGVKEDLSAWLCPQINRMQKDPDIVAVGFQEIVELSPQQIMSTDPIRRQAWEDAVGKTLNENAKRHASEEYIMLRSGQLVGAALIIFVRTSTLASIKNVEGSVKKTGMSGIAGNKGAVAIRMDYANTRICFVTAHLAAGFANYEERNRDYRTISHGLRFQRNRSIEDHDTIIWLGDFNYRIGLNDDKVRRFIQAGDLESLYANDQLNLQMIAGRTFPHYSEARITFMPTYKFNNGTDEYDTSEKARIPAWCDRVLRKGSNLRQINYTTAPLRFSDHRPVYATFHCTISRVDEAVRKSLSHEIYAKRRSELGNSTANSRNDSVDEDLLGYESIAPGLPPASSDQSKWWLDNGLPARSTLQPPNNRSVLNTQRPSNPFAPSPEPDWVTVSRPSSSLDKGEQSRNNTRKPSSISTSRKLPPPYNPVHSPPSHIQPPVGASQAVTKTAESNTKSLSRSSTASSTASTTINRKPAPPVPNKPALLSAPSTQQKTPPLPAPRQTHNPLSSTTSSSDRKLAEVAEATQNFPPPPRRATGPSFIDTQQQRSLHHAKAPPKENDGPSLPPRQRKEDSMKKSMNSSGLMDREDDDGGGAMGIPSLRPQNR